MGFSVLRRLEIFITLWWWLEILVLKFDWMVERVGSEGGVGSLNLTCHSFIYLTGTRKLGYIGTTKKRHGMIEITQIRIRKVTFVLSMSMFVF